LSAIDLHLAKKDIDVAAEDVFFHRYFNNIGKPAATKKNQKQRDNKMADDASFASDEEDEVWNVMRGTAPDLEGLEDGDDDDVSDMSDFAAEMDGDQSDVEMADGVNDDDDGSVDIEAGIFDDSDDELEPGAAIIADEDDDEEFEGLDSDTDGAKKGKDNGKDKGKWKEAREKKKKFKALPTFASAADYAQMLDDDEDEDLA